MLANITNAHKSTGIQRSGLPQIPAELSVAERTSPLIYARTRKRHRFTHMKERPGPTASSLCFIAGSLFGKMGTPGSAFRIPVAVSSYSPEDAFRISVPA